MSCAYEGWIEAMGARISKARSLAQSKHNLQDDCIEVKSIYFSFRCTSRLSSPHICPNFEYNSIRWQLTPFDYRHIGRGTLVVSIEFASRIEILRDSRNMRMLLTSRQIKFKWLERIGLTEREMKHDKSWKSKGWDRDKRDNLTGTVKYLRERLFGQRSRIDQQCGNSLPSSRIKFLCSRRDMFCVASRPRPHSTEFSDCQLDPDVIFDKRPHSSKFISI